MQFELCSNGEAEVLHKILEVVLNIIWNVDSYGSPAVSRPVQLVVVGTDVVILRETRRVYWQHLPLTIPTREDVSLEAAA